MFDIGWSELLVIGTVAVVVIGPKELPQVMRGLGQMVRRAQYLKFAMSRQFDEFMREHDLNDLRTLPKQTVAYDEAEADEMIAMPEIPQDKKRESKEGLDDG